MQLWRLLILVSVCSLLQSCASCVLSDSLQSGKSYFIEGNYKEAFHRLLPVAACGDRQAEYAVGYMYYYGYGVPRDGESGIFWMNKAAAQGYQPAIRALNLIKQPQNYQPGPQHALSEEASVAKEGYQGNHEEVTHEISYGSDSHTPVALLSPPHASPANPYGPKNYSFQVYGAYHLADAEHFRKRLATQQPTHIWHTEHNGRDWYILTYGHYTSLAQTRLAKPELPEQINELEPWVRNVEGLESVG